MTLAGLQEKLAKRGQWLSLDPPWPERATLGGILASNASGPRRHLYGSARDLLIGLTVVMADGSVVRGGGKVVKNVAGYDLPKLFIGSFGTLGVIVEATVKLRRARRRPPSSVARFHHRRSGRRRAPRSPGSVSCSCALELTSTASARARRVRRGWRRAPDRWTALCRQGRLASSEVSRSWRHPRLVTARVLDGRRWKGVAGAGAWGTRPSRHRRGHEAGGIAEPARRGPRQRRHRPAQWPARLDGRAARGSGSRRPCSLWAAARISMPWWRRSPIGGDGGGRGRPCPDRVGAAPVKERVEVWTRPGRPRASERGSRRNQIPAASSDPGRFVGGI